MRVGVSDSEACFGRGSRVGRRYARVMGSRHSSEGSGWPKASVLGAAFAGPDDGALVEMVWGAIEKRLESGGFEDLSQVQKDVWLTCCGGGVIDNGGFQYFLEADDPRAEAMVRALERIGADEGAASLRRLLDRFPDRVIHEDFDARMEFLEELAEDPEVDWFEGEFEAGYSETEPLIAAYIRAHEGEFVGLPEPESPPPERHEVPSPAADDRAVVEWLRSMSHGVYLREYSWPDGRQRMLRPRHQLPEGALTLTGFELSESRRDLDAVLQFLATWSGRETIARVEIEGVRSYLTEDGIRALPSLPSLERLTLKHCGISDENIQALRGCERLRVLDLSNNEAVTDVAIGWLAERFSLESLQVSGTSVEGRTLSGLTRLRRLEIAESLEDVSLSFVAAMPALVELAVFQAPLDGPAIEALARAAQLEELTLWYTGLREVDLEPLVGHPSLRFLNFEGLKLSKVGATIISQIPGIRGLMINNTDRKARKILESGFPEAELELS